MADASPLKGIPRNQHPFADALGNALLVPARYLGLILDFNCKRNPGRSVQGDKINLFSLPGSKIV